MKIKNLKDRVVNLGTMKGRMLSLNPGEVKEIDNECKVLFENRLIQYAEGGFIDIEKSEKKIQEIVTKKTKKTSKTVKT